MIKNNRHITKTNKYHQEYEIIILYMNINHQNHQQPINNIYTITKNKYKSVYKKYQKAIKILNIISIKIKNKHKKKYMKIVKNNNI